MTSFPNLHLLVLSTGILLSSLSISHAEKLPLQMITNSAAEIDYIIENANKAKGIQPNPIVDDATFLRRSYISIIGRIPTYQETKSFLDLDAKSPNKRSDLLDSLVYSKGYNSQIFNFYANLLRLQTSRDQHGLGWHMWLKKAVNDNMPYNKMVFEMLSATGHCSETPAVGYALRDRGMLLDNISNTAKIFLGTQIGCAQCHDHPFEDWTQKQYYELAAFGSQIDYQSLGAQKKIQETVAFKINQNNKEKTAKRTRKDAQNLKGLRRSESRDLRSLFKDFNKNATYVKAGKELKLPSNYEYNDGKPGDTVTPHVLFGNLSTKSDKKDIPPHEQLATWVTSNSNPMFTKVFANRLWKHALGYGLVEPVDNWTERSNMSHPEVLDTLVQILHASDYDTRELLRVIYHTKTFQRAACDFEITDGRVHDFRGPMLRRMSAEQIYDSLLTLEKGNIDALENIAQQIKWEQYTSGIDSIFSATPQQIIKIDDQLDIEEDATRKYQQVVRELRIKKAQAANDDKKSEIAKIDRKLAKLYAKIKEVRAKVKSDQKMSMDTSMVPMSNLRVRDRKLLRASEMSSPFKPGSFARDFGASDRITTDSQHTHASIPQALTMLNGKQIKTITDENGKMAQQMKSAHRGEQRLDVLFLSIYNKYPSKQERTDLKYVARSRQDIKILAKAMLNSKRFLFIQ
ncbi:DUF1549 domain-containing protein [Rubritalea profundi]|uniref:DUF1549 domain-containing protein n=1 Tax=Rubritalea profundi TaxID=1658618 RepID=A0A2S7TY40_9BACT|nr:DUF1549 domain-containing protein [Rubritalea profundi]PQJ27141.1 hypothetical protein BSZ32_00585 [Rubritalea profundi]